MINGYSGATRPALLNSAGRDERRDADPRDLEGRVRLDHRQCADAGAVSDKD
jgi:hypothetical protein